MIDVSIIDTDSVLNDLLSPYTPEVQAALKHWMIAYIKRTNQETTFRWFIQHNELHAVWNTLQLEKDNSNSDGFLVLTRLLLHKITPAEQTYVLDGVVQFIRNYLPKVVSLDLSNNGLTTLPESFGSLTQLKVLNLSNNQLTSLPATFVDLTQLEILELGSNWLHALPKSFENLINLNYLDLRYNKLGVLPTTLLNLTQLKNLLLDVNQLIEFSDSFQNINLLALVQLLDDQLVLLGSFIDLNKFDPNYTQPSALQRYRRVIIKLPNTLTTFPLTQEEQAFQHVRVFNSFHQLGRRLDQAIGKSGLNLRGMLLNCTPAMQLQLSEGFVHFICNHVPDLTVLDLSCNNLTGFPDSFEKLTKLEILELFNNKLGVLPPTFGELTNLQILYLNNNKLTTLPESFENLTQLHQLYLHNNQLATLPKSFGKLTQLRTLYLHNNQLATLPKSFGKLTQLRTLYLHNNQLQALPKSFGKLTQLKLLELANNQLTTLPVSFNELKLTRCTVDPNLNPGPKEDIAFPGFLVTDGLDLASKKLDQAGGQDTLDWQRMLQSHPALQSQPMQRVVQLIGNHFPGLVEAALSDNGPTELSAIFSSFAQLKLLELADNASLAHLKLLELIENQLNTLPLSFHKPQWTSYTVKRNLKQALDEEIALQNLLVANRLDPVWKKLDQQRGKDTLDLRGMLLCNQAVKTQVLEEVIQFIGKHFPDLVELDLSCNLLTALPDRLGELTNLNKLDLYNNQLTSLPATFVNLTQLKLLVLYNNQLTALPDYFGNLNRLQRLELSNNKLKALPATFVNLTQLERLDLSLNQLTALPNAFGELTQLHTLYLHTNQLQALPADFGELTQLKKLHLDRNLLTKLPLSFQKLTKLKIWTV